MGNITQLSSVLQSASAATKRVFEILDEPEEKENKVDVTLPETILGNVSFEHVDFAYDPKTVDQDLNFEVKSRADSSSRRSYRCRKNNVDQPIDAFYDVTHGAIKIDGIDTKSMSRSDVRSLFGMVLQDAWLYEGTIADNIRFGKVDATDYEVVDAAKQPMSITLFERCRMAMKWRSILKGTMFL